MALRLFHPTRLVRSGGPVEEPRDVSVCLACGCELAPLLIRTGSIRCQDCRDEHAPLRADLVEVPTAHRAAA
jgi:hypothetical protein